MTVQQLIEILSQKDPQLPVAISLNGEYWAEGNDIKVRSWKTYKGDKEYLIIGDDIVG